MTDVLCADTSTAPASPVAVPQAREEPPPSPCGLPAAEPASSGEDVLVVRQPSGDDAGDRIPTPVRRVVDIVIASVVLAVALMLIVIMVVVLPPLGVSYYAARGWVKLIDRMGLGDS